jgi:hypothetical protein
MIIINMRTIVYNDSFFYDFLLKLILEVMI